MSNFVKISTIGARNAVVKLSLPPERQAAQVTDYWKDRIGQVLPDRPDLIVLPEMCDLPKDCPEGKIRSYYEARGARMQKALAGIAREHRCYVTYPTMRRMADGTFRNSIILLDRGGGVAGIYNKNHLVIAENAEWGSLYGKEPAIIQCDFGRVGGAICFDLNYDELRQQYARLKPDLILFCSMYHGGLMQRYWAYSCRCHFVSAISGLPSAIISPVGEIVATTTNYFDFVTATVNLDCAVAHLDGHFDKLKAMKAKYGTEVKIMDPGLLAPVLFSSESRKRTVKDLIREFGIELLDDYFDRCRAHRREPGRIEP